MFNFFSGLGNLFNGLFQGSMGGAPQAPQAAPQQDSLFDLFYVRPDLQQKYGASYTPPKEAAYQPQDQPIDALQAAITAPFTAPPVEAQAPRRTANVPAPQLVREGLAQEVATDFVVPTGPKNPVASPMGEAPPSRATKRPEFAAIAHLRPDEVRAVETVDLLPEVPSYDAPNLRPLSLVERVQLSTGPQVKGAIPRELGAVSAKYESGGRGVGFISSGKNDPGGQSYGVHQLSGAYSMGAFLRSPEGAPFRKAFEGLKPMTAAFNNVYRQLAKTEPEAFAAAQKAFYTRTHFEPLAQHAAKLGFNINNRGVQEALFSMSVQHGGAKKIVNRAAYAANGDPAKQIRALYDARSNYVRGVKLPSDTKAAVLNRYRREVFDALRLASIE